MAIPLIKVPRYHMTLPFSERVVEYRPFLVKEEKVLLMAKDSDNVDLIVNTVGDIVNSCTEGVVDASRDPMVDVQFAYLQIRGKSIGEEIEYVLKCGECSHKSSTVTNINDFTLLKHFGHSTEIVLDENNKLLMKYPTFSHYKRLFSVVDDAGVYNVMSECIDSLVKPEEVIKVNKDNQEEMAVFLMNLLPLQFEKVETFFSTMPVLQTKKDYVCQKCGTANTVTINGISNFFA